MCVMDGRTDGHTLLSKFWGIRTCILSSYTPNTANTLSSFMCVMHVHLCTSHFCLYLNRVRASHSRFPQHRASFTCYSRVFFACHPWRPGVSNLIFTPGIFFSFYDYARKFFFLCRCENGGEKRRNTF